MLNVRHGSKAIQFYEAAFAAIQLYRIEDPSGAVVAQLSADGAEFWVTDESPVNRNFSPESLGGGTTRIILTVPDPDTTFTRAVEAGASIIWPISNQHGWRIGRIVDPFGHHWEIGRPLTKSS